MGARVKHASAGLALLVLLLPGTGVAEAAAIHGPRGISRDKVLVIGTDGTRWDLVRSAMEAGRAPNLARLARRGFGMPTVLKYQPPEALTISEVGWCSIATGVWPAKHGVFGYYINEDPGQATKNGYPDFLTRLEQERPKLSTFVASDWPNISLHENGGPIFGDEIDTKDAVFAPGTIAGYDGGDQKVTDAAARYLRRGDPDAGFVYLGVVDESAHLSGSATPTYSDEIAATDRRIGKLIQAVRSRPRRERWTIIVTTDHGEQNLDYPSQFSHGFGSRLERTSFVVAAGAGISGKQPADSVHVVDIAPTVAARLGMGVDPAWNLDGASFSRR